MPKPFTLKIAYVMAILFVLAHIFFSITLYRDCAGCYAILTRSFAAGDWGGAFNVSLPILNPALAGMLASCGIPVHMALFAISGFFYIAAIPVLYKLLRLWLPENISGWGTLLFVCAPRIIRLSCAGLLESSKIFFFTLAVYLIIQLFRKPDKKLTALYLGLSLGGLSLCRSEAIGNAFALCATLGIAWLLRRVPWRQIITGTVIIVAAWAAVLAPRVILNYTLHGYCGFDYRLEQGIIKMFQKNDIPENNNSQQTKKAVHRAHDISLSAQIKHSSRGNYEVYFIAALLGITVIAAGSRYHIWRKDSKPDFIKWNNEYFILFAALLSNHIIFVSSGILAHRYFTVNAGLMMLFTLIGFYYLYHWIKGIIPQILLITGAVVILALQAFNGCDNLMPKYRIDREIGYYIRDNAKELGLKPDSRVLFSKTSPIWYWTGFKCAVAPDTLRPPLHEANDFDLILWDKEEAGIEILYSRSDLERVNLPADFPVEAFKHKEK